MEWENNEAKYYDSGHDVECRKEPDLRGTVPYFSRRMVLRLHRLKCQNMALNSFITEDGAEMGRAQVMQAEAAKIRPDARMNPILLKPTSDVGSQVIVNGHVLGNMPAASYFKYKKQLVPEIMKAYRSLEEEYDIIVIEGAGSPAEINLKKNRYRQHGHGEDGGRAGAACRRY